MYGDLMAMWFLFGIAGGMTLMWLLSYKKEK